MSDTTRRAPVGQQQVSEEQAREYLAKLRSVPADQVVAEVLSGLLNAAQAKLGRKDARLLIDLSASTVEHARPYVSAELAKQVDQVLGQLRLGQVQAEKAVANQEQAEPNDLAEIPTPPAGTAGQGQSAAQPTAPPQQQPSAARSPKSKLWIPGRDF